MIPKKIHYCWFGGAKKSKLAKQCIKSWKKKCPGYEIIEWNESNFDISKSPIYVQQAYNAKKWAFVTDYVRLYVMTTYGGIYMDTDVEVIKPLDGFLHHQAFSGFENDTNIPTGIMACRKGFPLFLEFLEYYTDAVFLKDNGEMNLTTNVAIMTDITKKYGLQQNGSFQIISGFALYPKEYFAPKSFFSDSIKITENTHSIHHFEGTWLPMTNEEKKQRNAAIKKRRDYRKKAKFKDTVRYFPNRVLMKMIGEEKYKRLKGRFSGDKK